jgi:poly-gamma-glutamate biosynthesis protein PgsC/CapC
MEDLIITSIGLGLVVSLVFSEVLGIAAGGMVVPGYFALYLDQPMMILTTIMIAYLTYIIVHSLSSFMIIYGRRRTVLMIITAFLLGALLRHFGQVPIANSGLDIKVVGYIIPGLIAIWMDRQGPIETLSALTIASVVVRLGLIIINGGDLLL